jgi:amino-acid N-acetyltransferase
MTKFGDLRGILQYVPQFRGRIFVLAIDGAVIASKNFSNILLDLAVLHSLNVRIVLVHGAGQQIRDLGRERGVAISNDDGTGVTDRETLELSIDAITRLTSKLMQDLTSIQLRAATANALTGHPAGIIQGVDREFTGTIERVDGSGLKAFLKEEMIPVVAPLAYDGHGGTLRVNSDAAALEVAEALGADKILFITHGRLESADGLSLRHLNVAQAEELLVSQKESLSKRLYSVLSFATRACAKKIPRVHIIDGKQPEVLLAELFSNEGVGTMVYVDEYDQIRPARHSDVQEILSMIGNAVADEELVSRSRADIVAKLGDYHILDIDGNAVGCLAVHEFPDDDVVELACLYVKRDHEKQGYGRRMVKFAERKAKSLGAKSLFALSTQASEFFKREHGFEKVSPEELPKERYERYKTSGRNSVVLKKILGA